MNPFERLVFKSRAMRGSLEEMEDDPDLHAFVQEKLVCMANSVAQEQQSLRALLREQTAQERADASMLTRRMQEMHRKQIESGERRVEVKPRALEWPRDDARQSTIKNWWEVDEYAASSSSSSLPRATARATRDENLPSYLAPTASSQRRNMERVARQAALANKADAPAHEAIFPAPLACAIKMGL